MSQQGHAVKHIALIGNPNSGKTTLFNALSGSNQFVGNWPGVTVEKKEASLIGFDDIKLVDLPGIYSLAPYSPEEHVAREYLLEERPELVVVLVDASNLERNLYLVTQVMETHLPIVIALNMMDRLEERGDKMDIEGLEERLGIPICPISALRERGIDQLIATIQDMLKGEPKIPEPLKFNADIEAGLAKITELITPYIQPELQRFFAVRLFEKDPLVMKTLYLPQAILDSIAEIRDAISNKLQEDPESLIAGGRYDAIDEHLSQVYEPNYSRHSVSEKIDRIVTSRIFGIPIFIAVMFFVYWISTFGGGLGKWIGDWVNDVLIRDIILQNVRRFLESIGTSPWLTGLIVDGGLQGAGAVIGFLPQMTLLFICLTLLEQIGYMSRVAFLMDRIFKRFGLSGKSFIPIIVSSGCAVPRILSTRTIERVQDKRMTVMLASFIPCGAKLPAISLIAGSFFGDAWWFAPVVYFICILAILLGGLILKKFPAFEGKSAPFVLEMPPYHIPGLRSVAKQVWDQLKNFLQKAGTLILLSSLILWLFTHLTPSLQMTFAAEESILAKLGKAISPIFKPLGFPHWQAVVATAAGFVAKENLVSSMAVFFPIPVELQGDPQSLQPFAQELFTAGQLGGFSFLMFNLLNMPCVAAVGAIRREMQSAKWTGATIAFQMITAYSASFIFFQIGRWFTGHGFTWVTLCAVILLIVILFLAFRQEPQRKETL